MIAGRITIGGLTLYYQAFQQSRNTLTDIFSGVGGMYENALFLSNLFDFMAFAPELPVRPDPLPMPTVIREGITLDHVSFKYPGTDKWVLEDINFTIAAGETVALVGANGAGKTTLVKLLTRLYDPTDGRILIDGVDLRDFDPAEVRSRAGVIFQDYVKFQLSVRENVGFGRIDAMDDQERIENAVLEAGAESVVAGLPQGYDTPLGRWFQDGQELSIGQWQKIALARAFMRDADLLILDEPTASLDVRSEFEVFQAFHELTAGKMGVLISHRFSTVRMADRIIVIEDGRVIENGTHTELLLAERTLRRTVRYPSGGVSLRAESWGESARIVHPSPCRQPCMDATRDTHIGVSHEIVDEFGIHCRAGAMAQDENATVTSSELPRP